jgi:hypothetical protein
MTVPTQTRRAHRDLDEGGVESFSWVAFCEAMLDEHDANGMTPEKLANVMGASHEAVGRWMAGIAVPKPGYLKQAARILHRAVEDFYE